PREPDAPSPAGSAAAQSLAWFETQPLPGPRSVGSIGHPGTMLPAGIIATRSANSKPTCSPTNSPPPDSYPICPTDRNTAGRRPPNAFPVSENPYHPQSKPPRDLVSAWWEAHTAAPRPAFP